MISIPATTPRTRRGERGSAVLELPLILGLIVIPFALLVLQFPLWVERQAAADDAAAEVARAVAIHGLDADVDAVVAAIESARRLPSGTLRVGVETDARPGDPITARVVVDMPTLTLPVFGVVGRSSWTTTHTERLPDYGAVEP